MPIGATFEMHLKILGLCHERVTKLLDMNITALERTPPGSVCDFHKTAGMAVDRGKDVVHIHEVAFMKPLLFKGVNLAAWMLRHCRGVIPTTRMYTDLVTEPLLWLAADATMVGIQKERTTGPRRCNILRAIAHRLLE